MAVSVDAYVPAGAVDDAVMMAAKEGHGLDVGFAEVFCPLVDVVGVGVGWVCFAAGEDATAVSECESPTLVSIRTSDLATHVERDSEAVDDDGVQVGVAAQGLGIGVGEFEASGGVHAVRFGGVDDEGDLGSGGAAVEA